MHWRSLILLAFTLLTSFADTFENRFKEPGPDGPVVSLIDFGGSLFAAGDFSSINGVEAQHGLARWDGKRWLPVNLPGERPAHSAFVAQNRLFVSLRSVQSFDDGGLLMWNGRAWESLGRPPGYPRISSGVATDGTSLYVEAYSDTEDPPTRRVLAKWNRGWTVLASTKTLGYRVTQIQAVRGRIYAFASIFEVAEGKLAAAQLVGGTWMPLIGRGVTLQQIGATATDGN